MAEESRDCSEIANVPGSSACKSSSSDPNFTMAEEKGHLNREIPGSTSTSDRRMVFNVNMGNQGDVVTGDIRGDLIKGVSGHVITHVQGNVVVNPPDWYESEGIPVDQNISTSMEGYVGMESHPNKMLSYLDIERSDDVRIIGIWGMGGIGKTTIAQVVFEKVKAQFDGVSFLANVREEIKKNNGAVHLQKQLLFNLLKKPVNVQHTEMGKIIIRNTLCTKRVLIVLDDVDQDEQLEALCDREWFGPGSRIIITLRNEHLLSAIEGGEVYRVNPLTEAEALQLFRMKAFKKGQPVEEEFLKLSKEFVKYADGHPLAIKVLGSSVRGRKLKLWSSTLDRLRKDAPKQIIDVLKVSFDELEETEKKTFLDIACFFKGWDIHGVTRILQGCDHCPDIDIEVLIEKSMITLFGRNLWMHDAIQELGWEIVNQECREQPEKHSRLWISEEIIHVLDRNKATSAIQSILLQGPAKNDVVHSINDSFSNMDSLRLLKIKNVKFSGNIKYLSNELQYLEWHECPLDSFPSDFQPDNLVELHMHSSRMKHLWKEEKGWKMLRGIDLSGSQYLTSTPDFTQVPNLEALNLEDCTSLVEVHPSLGVLKKLIGLNMRNCKSIENLPPFTSLESLSILNLSQCSRLNKLPELEGNMKSLSELILGKTSIEKLPPSVERLTGLEHLCLSDCSKLVDIPENLNKSMEKLCIGGTATRDSSFLVGMKNLKSLVFQGCKGDAPRSMLSPATLSSLTSLIELNLSDCNLMDGDIPDDLSSLISLRVLNLSGNCFVRLPESFSQLSKLEMLYLTDCKQLELVPKKLPLSLKFVHAEGCTSLMDFPNQIKVLNSVTINSLDSSATGRTKGFTWIFPTTNGGESELHLIRRTHTEEEPAVRLSLPSRDTSNSALQSMSHRSFGVEADNEIPEWFGHTSTSNPISIPIGDKKWEAVATCAVFSVNNTTADVDFSNYWYHITVETDVVSLEPFVVDNRQLYGRIRPSSDLRLISFAPSRMFPKWELKASTMVRARFETNNPFVVVQKCGIHLAYEKDAGWFNTDKYEGIKCFTFQKNVVLLSGWVSGGDKCLNWEKFIPPSEEDYSTHVLRKNVESVLPRYLEALNHSSAIYKFNLSRSPAGFPNVGFLMPARCWFQNLHKSTKSMGFAIQASKISQEVGLGDNYRLLIPRYLEASNHSICAFKFNLSGSPAWFHKEVGFFVGIPKSRKVEGTDSMEFCGKIEIPQNLHKNKKWMGFAIHASIAQEVIAEEEAEDNYHVDLRLGTEDEFHKVGAIGYRRSSHDNLLVFYIPPAQLPEALFAKTSTFKMHVHFMINSRHVKFRTIGVRVVYQQDIQGFADAIIQCIQKADSLEIYNKFVVTKWIELIRLQRGHLEGMSNPKERDSKTRREKEFELHSQKYRNWDWSASILVRCNFYGAEISKWKWFMHIKQGNSAEIPLHPSLLDDANWLGIAVCAFSRLCGVCPIDQDSILGSTSPDSKYDVVTCRLDCDGHILYKWRPFTEFDASSFAMDVTWFLYLPRSGKWLKSWRQCKLARATFSWSNQYLAVQSCALGLVYKKDVERLVHTLTSCELP